MKFTWRMLSKSETMRAVVVRKFGGPEVLKVEEVPVPKNGQKEVLIKIHASGVNPVETYIRSGNYPKLPELPYTPGADAAGIIEAVGSGVTKFKVGDRVFCCTRKRQTDYGTYADYAVCPDDSCWILPQRLSFVQGANIGIPYFTAYRAIFQRANAKPHHTVLVHGASGAVGLASVQLCKARGMTVFGTAGTDAGLELVKKSGATQVFNHKNPDYTKELMKATDGQGFDIILEMLANVNLGKDCEVVRLNGTVVVIGSRGSVEINPRHLMMKDASVIGINLSVFKDETAWDDMERDVSAGLESGTLTPVVDKEYPLEKVADVHKDIIENSGAKGNLTLNMELR